MCCILKLFTAAFHKKVPRFYCMSITEQFVNVIQYANCYIHIIKVLISFYNYVESIKFRM